jgi:hypothetical protein
MIDPFLFDAADFPAGSVFQVRPRGPGLGEDWLIGGPGRAAYSIIDLSHLEIPVSIEWIGAGDGVICDGSDSIVFQGITAIVLPPVMRDEATGGEIVVNGAAPVVSEPPATTALSGRLPWPASGGTGANTNPRERAA